MHDEDVIAEATALSPRAEYEVKDDGPVTVGLFADGRVAVYCGDDPVFQIDGEGRLRRAYVGGRLLRADGRTLAILERQRSDDATTLERRDLSLTETSRFLGVAAARLSAFTAALADGLEPTRAEPDGGGPELARAVVPVLNRFMKAPRVAPPLVDR